MDKSTLPPMSKKSTEEPEKGWWTKLMEAGSAARRRNIQRRVKSNAAQQRYKIGK